MIRNWYQGHSWPPVLSFLVSGKSCQMIAPVEDVITWTLFKPQKQSWSCKHKNTVKDIACRMLNLMPSKVFFRCPLAEMYAFCVLLISYTRIHPLWEKLNNFIWKEDPQCQWKCKSYYTDIEKKLNQEWKGKI